MRLPGLALAVLLALTAVAGASTTDDTPDDDDALAQGQSVVVGTFDGASRQEIVTHTDQYDDDGRAVTRREVVTVYSFAVREVLDGVPLEGTIEIRTVGGALDGVTTPSRFQPPVPGTRVALALSPDRRGGQVPVHARQFDVRTDAQLAALRARVETVRAPAEIPAERVAENLQALVGVPGVDDGAGGEAPAATGELPDVPEGSPLAMRGDPTPAPSVAAPHGSPQPSAPEVASSSPARSDDTSTNLMLYVAIGLGVSVALMAGRRGRRSV